MAVSRDILKRLESLESKCFAEPEMFIFADGHRERGNLYDLIGTITREGKEYFNRSPQTQVIDYAAGDDDDNLFPAIFRGVLESIKNDG